MFLEQLQIPELISCKGKETVMEPMEERKKRSYGKLLSTTRGLLLAFLSGILISTCGLFVKYLRNIHPGQLAAYQLIAISSFALPQLVLRREKILCPPEYRISILFTGLTHSTVIFLNFFALQHIPIGVQAVLFASYPAFVTVLGKVFLKESFGLLEVSALLTTIFGMFSTIGLRNTLSKNGTTYSTESIYGFVAVSASAVICAVFIILTRKLQNIHSSVLLFTGGIVGAVESIIITALVGHFSLHYHGLQQCLIIFLGLVSYAAFGASVLSLQYAEAGPVSTMRVSGEVLFSFLLQVIIFGDIPDAITISGAALICISIALLGFREKINACLPKKCAVMC